MPIIRQLTYGFVHLWNKYKIRRQKKRPNHPTGSPHILYHYTDEDVKDFVTKLNAELLSSVREEVAEYGMLKTYILMLLTD
jgi:hypothetical protein